jgi:hypothetical protein
MASGSPYIKLGLASDNRVDARPILRRQLKKQKASPPCKDPTRSAWEHDGSVPVPPCVGPLHR